jgi:hypothetical protein
MLTNAAPRQLSNFASYEEPLPGIGRLLSQGAIAGAFGYFLCLIFVVLDSPNPYDFLLAAVMPVMLGCGAVFGLVVALPAWAITKILKRPLGRVARLTVTTVVVLGISSFCYLEAMSYFELTVIFILLVFPVGLTVGSHYAPGSALVHGMRRGALLLRMRPSRAHEFWLGTTISFLFRILSVFACIEALFVLILTMREPSISRETLVTFVAFVYFLLQTIFSFDNARSLWLVLITIVGNAVGTYLLFEYAQALEFARYVIGGYLFLWFVFLMMHWGGMTPLFSQVRYKLDPLLGSIKKELRYYYLID